MIRLLLKIIIFSGLILGVIIWIGNSLSIDDLKNYCKDTAIECYQKADAIVTVSGGKTNYRTAHAIELYRQKIANKLIFSGAAADKNSPSNASEMKKQALQNSVSESDIILEEKSRNTRENAKFVSEIIKNQSIKRIILVTSGYHQRRAILEFKHATKDLNIEIIASPAPDPDWGEMWFLRPRGWFLAISEAVGLSRFYLGLGD